MTLNPFLVKISKCHKHENYEGKMISKVHKIQN
jgi:hypothetical protein